MESKDQRFVGLVEEAAASIEDTLSLFKEPAPSGGKKVEWKDVLTVVGGVARHATTAGVLWKGKVTKKEGIENIRSYIQSLQGFLILGHGSTIGYGPTLLSFVDLACKQVANSSLDLLRGAIASSSSEVDLPVLVGRVWEACEAVKKTPSSNRVAIGRTLTQVALSVKDVLRELGDFKHAVAQDTSRLTVGNVGVGQCNSESDGDGGSDDELSNDVSAAEMQVVEAVKDYVSSLLGLLKQLLHVVAGTSRAVKDTSSIDMNETPFLEKLLELSKDVGVGVDELGASLYPPQEIEALQARVDDIEGLIENIQAQVYSLLGCVPEEFSLAVGTSKVAGMSLRKLLHTSISSGLATN